MFDQIWSVVAKIFDAALIPIIGAFGLWGIAQVKRWQSKSDLKTMKQNATDAVQSVEQLYPNIANEEKAKLALQWAQHLNEVAGIKIENPVPAPVITQNQTQTLLNESSVSTLPPKETVPGINDAVVPMG
jgi:hypothetical protein